MRVVPGTPHVRAAAGLKHSQNTPGAPAGRATVPDARRELFRRSAAGTTDQLFTRGCHCRECTQHHTTENRRNSTTFHRNLPLTAKTFEQSISLPGQSLAAPSTAAAEEGNWSAAAERKFEHTCAVPRNQRFHSVSLTLGNFCRSLAVVMK